MAPVSSFMSNSKVSVWEEGGGEVEIANQHSSGAEEIVLEERGAGRSGARCNWLSGEKRKTRLNCLPDCTADSGAPVTP